MQILSEILATHAAQNPNALLFSYPSSGTNVVDYTALDIETKAQRLAKRYSESLPKHLDSEAPREVVAVLANSNFDYVVTIGALAKLGVTTLLMSTRISDEAYRHLLRKTGCSHIILQDSFKERIERGVQASYEKTVTTISMDECAKAMDDVSLDNVALNLVLDPSKESEIPLWIIHSSGSTGLPKPVSLTNKSIMSSIHNTTQWFQREGFVTLPLFHLYGTLALFGTMYSGRKVSFHNCQLPLTGQNVLEELKLAKPRVMQSVPYVLKLLAETSEGIEEMKKLDFVFSAGSATPHELGTSLVKQGVKIMNLYGVTETGGLMSNYPDYDSVEDWNYLKPTPAFEDYAEWRPEGAGLFELCVKPGWPGLSATNREDGGYCTKDLFAPHPAGLKKWKYVSRLDDTIILNNGENANPIPLEGSVRPAPEVAEVAVVGAERSCLGMFVIRSEAGKDLSREDFLDRIWPYVEAGNKIVPGYSQITRDAIVLLPAGTQYPATDKGTLIRAAFNRKFKDEIDQLFANLDTIDSSSGLSLSLDETKAFIREAVEEVLHAKEQDIEIADDSDFFAAGLDSLMATALWRKITRGLNTGSTIISRNVAFEKPNINILSRYLYECRTGEINETASCVERMDELYKKYTLLEQHTPGNTKVDGEYVVLTGATGSLGAHLAAQLATRHDVIQVYCLIRASSHEKALARVVASLKERRVYSESALEKIRAFSSDLGDRTLGLAPEEFEEIRKNTTTVIHAAWAVNFNMDVSSFEAQCIRGSFNLINLCLGSPHDRPPRFNFCSSISTAWGCGSDRVAEKLYKFSDAMPMGYAQSKAISEHMAATAARETTIQARVLRIGQIVGDTVHGVWNANEAESLTIQAAHTIHALPFVPGDEDHSWLPVDTTAAAIIELSMSGTSEHTNGRNKDSNIVYHIVHPTVLKWNIDILPALREAGLEFDELEPKDWLVRLQSKPDPEQNPPMKLWEFFSQKYGNGMSDAVPYFETKRSTAESRVLRDAQPIGAELIKKYVDYWKAHSW